MPLPLKGVRGIMFSLFRLSIRIDLMHMTYSHGALAWGSIGLRVKAVVKNVPVADHKRVQSKGFDPQHGGAMTSVQKVYLYLRSH